MTGISALSRLPRMREYTSGRVSSYDTSGGNRDCWTVEPAERRVLCEIEGPGCIKHIWMTLGIPSEDYCRRIVLRIYWDDCSEPSVECPIGDFFGLGHGMRKNFVTAPLQMSPENGMGFNSWWAMPFERRVRIEAENQGEKAYCHYFYVDYEVYPSVEAVSGLAYFHAQWRREANTKGWCHEAGMLREDSIKDRQESNLDGRDNYIICEARGDGIYCGAHLDIDCFQRNPNDWYGEGDDMIFIDGSQWPPALHGTGTEDWYHCAYCPTQEYNGPYHGIILNSGNPEWKWKGKNTVYRYHIEDPLRFQKSILVSIEHGHANKLSNDYSSTAYYYLSAPGRGGPPLPGVEERLPRPDEPVYVARS